MTVCLRPHPFSSLTSSPQRTEPLRGDKGQTALTSKASQWPCRLDLSGWVERVGTVGPALSPLKMDFIPGHRKPGSQRLGVKPQRGSTVAAPPAVHGQPPAAVSPAGLANSYQPLGHRSRGRGRSPCNVSGSLYLESMAGVFCHNLAEKRHQAAFKCHRVSQDQRLAVGAVMLTLAALTCIRASRLGEFPE